MVEDQGGGGFQRRPDVNGATLGAMLRRVLGPRLRVARTPAGVAAQVYRVEVAERVLYVRIAEEDHENLSVDAALLEHLRAEGLHVPPVVHVEPFDQALAARCSSACRASAGSSVAPKIWPLRGTFHDYGEFVVSYLPDPWPGPLGALFSASELDRLWELVASERRRELGWRWAGPRRFDTTPIFQAEGRYTGLIDFGEIRGTEPLFDLGHFLLHGQESTPIPLVLDVLAGYGEVVALPRRPRGAGSPVSDPARAAPARQVAGTLPEPATRPSLRHRSSSPTPAVPRSR